MATPKKRMSPVRSGNRRRNLGIVMPALAKCANCGVLSVRHHACSACGIYNGRQVTAAKA